VKNQTGEKAKKLYTSYSTIYFIMVKLPALFIPRDRFMHFFYTAVLFSISKEIKERYRFILLLGK